MKYKYCNNIIIIKYLFFNTYTVQYLCREGHKQIKPRQTTFKPASYLVGLLAEGGGDFMGGLIHQNAAGQIRLHKKMTKIPPMMSIKFNKKNPTPPPRGSKCPTPLPVHSCTHPPGFLKQKPGWARVGGRHDQLGGGLGRVWMSDWCLMMRRSCSARLLNACVWARCRSVSVRWSCRVRAAPRARRGEHVISNPPHPKHRTSQTEDSPTLDGRIVTHFSKKMLQAYF